jgi:hypothetical protein
MKKAKALKFKPFVIVILISILLIALYFINVFLFPNNDIQTLILLLSLIVNLIYAYFLYNQINETTMQSKLNFIPALMPKLHISKVDKTISKEINAKIRMLFYLKNEGNSIAKDIIITGGFNDYDKNEKFEINPISPGGDYHFYLNLCSKEMTEFFATIYDELGRVSSDPAICSHPIEGRFIVQYRNIHEISFSTTIGFSVVISCNGFQDFKYNINLKMDE